MTVPFSNVAAAQVALREAARALTIADALTRADAGIADSAARGLAADLAHTLDAVAMVMRRIGHEPVPTSSAAQDLQALLHHVRDGAAMARHISGTDGRASRAMVSAGGHSAMTQDD